MLFGMSPGPGIGGSTLPPREQLTQLLSSLGTTAVWYQPGVGVTGTLNASGWANWTGPGSVGASGDQAQATGSAQPIVVSNDWTPKAYLPGVSGNYLSTTPVALTNFDVQGYIAADDWTSGIGNQAILSNGATGVNESLLFYVVVTTGLIGTYIFNALDLSSSAAPAFSDGVGMWLRARFVNNTGAGQYSMKYYTSTDGPDVASPSWTQLGLERTGASGTPTTPITALRIGERTNDTQVFPGRAFRVKLYDGPSDTTGVLVRDFNAADAGELTANGATFVSAATGEIYTLNNTGATPAQIVTSPSLLGNGTAHFMQTAAVTIPAPYTIISVERQISWTSGDVSFDGRTANSFACQQITGTPQLKMWDGITASASVSPTLGTYYIVTASQSAAGAATIQLNAGTAATGTLNATGLGGFTDWADGAGANFCNKQKKEGMVFTKVPSTAELLQIQQLLAAIHGISI